MIFSRVEKVLKIMNEQNVPQAIISDENAIFYLTGKWIHVGERMIVLYLSLDGNHKLFINELFPVYEDLGVEKVWFKDSDDYLGLLIESIDKNHPLGIDKNWPAKFLIRLVQENVATSFITCDAVDRARMFKDETEMNLMRAASKANDMAMERLVKLVCEGLSEKEMVSKLAAIYEDLGTSGFSFSPIIAYGANCADPHHGTDNTTPVVGDSVILDIGCIKDSYCSDMTRTVFYKDANEKAREVFQTVLDANKKAIEIIKPGVKFSEIDLVARNHIESKGYGKFFTHRTGHAIGLEVHDLGDVSSVNHETVQPGMIFSIEPGIYLPDEVGVRIEDLVLVTENGHEVLNSYNKDFTIV